AGTAYSSHGINMIPFFIYYSMFGFQRIGDLIWAAQNMRAKVFLIGGTAGRTTLNGEGLQHQDGHSLLNAIAFPNVRAYDPAYAYEMAIIILDGMRRLYEEGDTAMYYLMAGNENYVHTAMPPGVEEGVVRGMYKLKSTELTGAAAKVNLFGSGAILRHVLLAQELLAERYKIASNVWSVTSYTQLRRDAQACEHWNVLHPSQSPKRSYVEQSLTGESGVFVAASDYVRALPEQISRWVPGDYYALGTDGLGRSETREALRRHFEVDAESIALATLYRLHKQGKFDAAFVAKAIRNLGVNPDKIDPYFA
ncbi:MAG: pyruvate dehydrogenase (acetyl-transferring), homodimeric type, partial [Planctomycetia bacterium]|nr:pyruvate dehydrogenase (acetyl-transferring), homodimeric type [Planctomycetia bacterium]